MYNVNENQIEVTNTTVLENVARKIIFRLLRGFKKGSLTIADAWGQETFGDPQATLKAQLRVNNPKLYHYILLHGSLGLGEGYLDSMWDTNNITNLIRFFALNIETVNKSDSSIIGFFSSWYKSILYLCTPNTIRTAKKNIMAHYDLNNDFFALFLDQEMNYSSLQFKHGNETLEDAALNKNLALIDLLELKPTDRLIEIGSGWGSLATLAAKKAGCHVTTTTISEQQYSYVQQKIVDCKLEAQITALKQDYRHLSGKYDKLVSVEMIEAVGHQYLKKYFKKCSDMLNAAGVFVLQAIVIRDQQYQRAKNEVDFIKKHIFPGGFLPSMGIIVKTVSKYTDLSLHSVADLTHDYALTLKEWRNKFNSNTNKVISLGFDERFIRMWNYYLSYCEAGFLERNIMVAQIKFVKPQYRSKKMPN